MKPGDLVKIYPRNNGHRGAGFYVDPNKFDLICTVRGPALAVVIEITNISTYKVLCESHVGYVFSLRWERA
jgi:hypothetical protein